MCIKSLECFPTLEENQKRCPLKSYTVDPNRVKIFRLMGYKVNFRTTKLVFKMILEIEKDEWTFVRGCTQTGRGTLTHLVPSG